MAVPEELDILVIGGGGVTGAGAALDAVTAVFGPA